MYNSIGIVVLAIFFISKGGYGVRFRTDSTLDLSFYKINPTIITVMKERVIHPRMIIAQAR